MKSVSEKRLDAVKDRFVSGRGRLRSSAPSLAGFLKIKLAEVSRLNHEYHKAFEFRAGERDNHGN